jgi:hypothetical protein
MRFAAPPARAGVRHDSRCKRKNVADQTEACGAGIAARREEIETAASTFEMTPRHVENRRAANAPLARQGDSRLRAAGRADADLDEAEGIAIQGDDIDRPGAAAEAAFQDLIAVARQPPRRPIMERPVTRPIDSWRKGGPHTEIDARVAPELHTVSWDSESPGDSARHVLAALHALGGSEVTGEIRRVRRI